MSIKLLFQELYTWVLHLTFKTHGKIFELLYIDFGINN